MCEMESPVRTLAALLCPAAIGAVLAVAAASPATAESPAQDVVVTAQFREQALQQTPVAITVVSGRALDALGPATITDLAGRTPNVQLVPEGGAFGPSLGASIRGVGQYDFDPALESGVAVYLDDVYYPQRTGALLSLLDLDRVEILRGPQGTLAGRNAIGGAIRLFSTRPTGEGDGYLEATYGSFDRAELRGALDVPLVSDRLFLRLAGMAMRRDGYVERLDFACANPGDPAVLAHLLPTFAVAGGSCILGHEGGGNAGAARASLRWIASDRVELNLVGDLTDDRTQATGQTLLRAQPLQPWITAVYGVPYDSRFTSRSAYANYASFSTPGGLIGGVQTQPLTATDRDRVVGWGLSGAIDWKLSDVVALRSITALRGFTADWAYDNDLSPLPLSLGIDHENGRQFSQEARLSADLFEHVQLTLGAFYLRERSLYRAHNQVFYASPLLDYFDTDPVLTHTEAGFVHADWAVSGVLHLIGGIRYTAEDKQLSFNSVGRDGAPAPIVGAVTGQGGRYAGSHWDWRAALQAQWTPQVMTYVQVSTGFKGGGINPRPFFGPEADCPAAHPTCQIQPYGPETLQAYELGFKGELFQHRARVNLAAFLDDFHDIQMSQLGCPDFSPPGLGFLCAMTVNAGNAQVKGAEAEAEIQPARGLSLDASASYLDFQYTRLAPGTGVGLAAQPVYTPKWKWSGGLQYELALANLGSLTPRIEVLHQSSEYTTSTNIASSFIAGHTVANARLTWRSRAGTTQATLEVSNLANALYYVQTLDLSPSAGFVLGSPAPPREWAVTVRRRF